MTSVPDHHQRWDVNLCPSSQQVPNLDAAIANAEEKGWTVVGVNKQSPSWKEAFIHPKQVLVVFTHNC
jgi:hypothetical protein